MRMSDFETSLGERFGDCANWLVNRIEGQALETLDADDAELLQASKLAETDTALLLACQVGGCTVQWAMRKVDDGTLTREIHLGLSLCPSS